MLQAVADATFSVSLTDFQATKILQIWACREGGQRCCIIDLTRSLPFGPEVYLQ